MKNIPSKVISIVLYVMAGFMFIYTAWTIVYCIGYIGDLISSGQLKFAGNEYEIVSFYMSNCGQYAAFTAILFALGWIITRNPVQIIPADNPLEIIKEENNEDDLDDWFNESNETEEN